MTSDIKTVTVAMLLAVAAFAAGVGTGRATPAEAPAEESVEAPVEAGSRSIKPPAELGARDYLATVDRVLDGDTVDLKVRIWPNTVLEDRFRLIGINAPETRTRDLEEKARGKASTQWLIDKLAPHATITVRVEPKRGKYGRWLGTLLVPGADGALVNLNELIVAEGHAKVAKY